MLASWSDELRVGAKTTNMPNAEKHETDGRESAALNTDDESRGTTKSKYTNTHTTGTASYQHTASCTKCSTV